MNEPNEHDRIVQLEELYAHQQRLIQELNEVIVAMRGDVDRLATENLRLQNQIRQISTVAGDDLPHEKPPHY